MERADGSGDDEELVTALRWMEQRVRERRVGDGAREREMPIFRVADFLFF